MQRDRLLNSREEEGMATVVHTNINVLKRPDGVIEVKIVPPVTRVPNNDGVADAQLTWKVTGAALTALNWKSGHGQPTLTATSPTTMESAVYTKNTSPKSVNWDYEFTVQVNGGGPTLLIDPEVENLPPGQP
jgi:hypothetical protein